MASVAMVSEGGYAMDAITQRLAAAKAQESSAAKMMDTAQQVLEIALRNVEFATENLDSSRDEVRAVEALLNEAEARWQVIDVDMPATHTYFARPDITVDDLIANFFEPKFGEGEPDEAFGLTETDVKRMKEKQANFYNTGFKRFLMESADEDPNFLVKFVACATGSENLPHDNTCKINIVFDFSLQPNSYPLFHSIEHDVRLPGYEIFFGDYSKFKIYMHMVIGNFYNHPDME
ncbi:hypothetical protein ACHAXA_010357 [Cyclostephanos tholiformis]|uniref:Uncharacterized protein n=1 Tax=Cyclostephanos tholiformis TaxID=382380 RepID=A0ABD3RV18_9STRA